MEQFVNESEKISPGLLLSMETTAAASTDRYTILFRYTGVFYDIQEQSGLPMISLLNQFAVGHADKTEIQTLANLPQILYIDITRQMEYEQAVTADTRLAACFPMYDSERRILRGQGILFGVIDSGIDYFHPAFVRADGKSRIVTYWDQAREGSAPEPYGFGTIYSAEEINQQLQNGRGTMLPDAAGHGTAVASILAALSPEAFLAVVGTRPDTAAFLCAIDYVVRYAIAQAQPLVLNLSYGNNYGDHAGNSMVEQYLDALTASGKITIVTGTGNEGNAGRHRHIEGSFPQTIGIFVGYGMRTFNLQLWSAASVSYRFRLVSPDQTATTYISVFLQGRFFSQRLEDTTISIQIGMPSPFNPNVEIFISFQSASLIPEGYWRLEIYPYFSDEYSIDAWLPVAASTSAAVEFETPTSELSLTIPATSNRVISVGAYNQAAQTIAVFTARGGRSLQKPDVVAPGVTIYTAKSGGGYLYQTGTSFAVPFAASAAANLMQWGITDGNDPFLYGERLKAYLTSSAISLPGFDLIPNPSEGWGRLCANASVPRLPS